MASTPWYTRLFSSPATKPTPPARAAADDGDADMQFAQGLQCSVTGGAKPDFEQAARWYRKAAEQNHALAQFNLGIMFSLGQGVPQDDAEALAWTRRAAEGGDAGAQHRLGTVCHRNSLDTGQTGAAESRIEAYKWFHLAAATGYLDSSTACDTMTLAMTREEVTDGNQRAAAFRPRKPARRSADLATARSPD